MTDHSEAIEALARRKLADREVNRGPVANPQHWLISVIAGIKIDRAGRLATMPDGLPLHEQMRWIDFGPPASGQRIPPPREPMTTPEKMPAEAWRAGMDEARALLVRDRKAFVDPHERRHQEEEKTENGGKLCSVEVTSDHQIASP